MLADVVSWKRIQVTVHKICRKQEGRKTMIPWVRSMTILDIGGLLRHCEDRKYHGDMNNSRRSVTKASFEHSRAHAGTHS